MMCLAGAKLVTHSEHPLFEVSVRQGKAGYGKVFVVALDVALQALA